MVDVVGRRGVDAVAVLPCRELEESAMRRFGWELESAEAALLLAPT